MAGDGPSAPSSEPPGPGREDRELLKVLDALLADKSVQEIAVEVLEAADAAEPWDTDGGPRSTARRRIDKAEALRDGGYRAAFLEPRRKRRRRGAPREPGPGPEQAPLPA